MILDRFLMKRVAKKLSSFRMTKKFSKTPNDFHVDLPHYCSSGSVLKLFNLRWPLNVLANF